MKTGSRYIGTNTCEFTVWAPFHKDVKLKIVNPEHFEVSMKKMDNGYFRTVLENLYSGTRYYFTLDQKIDRPDPASHFQPLGVHGPSGIVDHTSFNWRDNEWMGIPPAKMIIYELHTGTFTPEGTFDAIILRIGELRESGINALNIMPVAQFPGERNWGYDGACLYAVQNSYGGPEGLKRLVNACHNHDIAVILDVVYNHLGPEGNYLRDFGPYFTDKYKTSWGDALNFDGPYNNEVRNFFIENALFWFRYYHVDALRLDAIHGIYDMSAKPFLRELAEKVEEYSENNGRRLYLIAESDLNDVRILNSSDKGGFFITHSIHF